MDQKVKQETEQRQKLKILVEGQEVISKAWEVQARK